ncbi:MAG: hypothetical protein NZ898_01725 [Myxococcota bacterium]|nr:hypothetical protein [Myxococcota bacterium]MDW8362717.1 hypothetical protein [Myxococcales bacterium]
MSEREALEALFRADRELRALEARLLSTPEARLVALLTDAVREARALDDRREAAMRLERLADLCAQVPGPEMADALVEILDDEDPSVRGAAADALLDVASERWAEVARAIERRLEADRPGPALEELPYLIAEIAPDGATRLLRRFLAHPDGEVVASALEACGELGDPGLLDAVERLRGDARTVRLLEGIDADAHDGTPATVGELAAEVIDALRPRAGVGRHNPTR